jgi:ubiquinone biosynthesis protein
VLGGLWLIALIAPAYIGMALIEALGRAPPRARSALDRWSSARFVAYARTHGALLIKVGQFIASRPDLFPEIWLDTCSTLLDQAPPRPFAAMRPVLEAAYDGNVEARFAEIEELALAAASFGQVHRARLHDGRVVAVKIQYPGLARLVAVDVRLVRLAMRLIRVVMRGFPFRDLAGELARMSRAELDYLQEAASADRLRPCLRRHGLDAPGVLWEHTRQRVLVMEYAEGVTLARIDFSQWTPERRLALAETIVDACLSMLLDEGLYHADPHAGNFIWDGRKLWLIDFGLTASVSRTEAELYRRFLAHLQHQDVDGMLDTLMRLGFVLPELERDELRALARDLYASLRDYAPRAMRGSRRQLEIGWRIGVMLRSAHGLIFPQHTILLARATGLLEGLCAELTPERSFIGLVRPLLARRFTVWTHAQRLIDEAREMWTALRSLPERIARLRSRADRTAHAVVAGCVLLASLHIPEGPLKDVAMVLSGAAAVLAMVRHGKVIGQ